MTEDELRNALVCAETISGSPAGLVPRLHAHRIAIEYANARVAEAAANRASLRSDGIDKTMQYITRLEAEIVCLQEQLAEEVAEDHRYLLDERDRLKEQLADLQAQLRSDNDLFDRLSNWWTGIGVGPEHGMIPGEEFNLKCEVQARAAEASHYERIPALLLSEVAEQ